MPTFPSFLNDTWLGQPIGMWAIFFGIIVVLLALDLGLFHRKSKKPRFRESLAWSSFYILLSIAFGAWIWHGMGAESGMEFYTAYAMELSLSFDNIFVMSLIFSALSIPVQYQHRVLFWGILGVLLMRGLMIGLGVALIAKFHWILIIFGIFLVGTGIKMLFTSDEIKDIEDNRILHWMRGHMLITKELHGQKFFVQLSRGNSDRKILWATPLFVTLVLIETADVIFAVDSVPAVFAVTLDPYIVYTSNIFAILGLRSLYFSLAAMVHRFEYLSKALALVLVFIGGKIMLAELTPLHIPTQISLTVVLALIASGVIISLIKTRPEK